MKGLQRANWSVVVVGLVSFKRRRLPIGEMGLVDGPGLGPGEKSRGSSCQLEAMGLWA